MCFVYLLYYILICLNILLFMNKSEVWYYEDYVYGLVYVEDNMDFYYSIGFYIFRFYEKLLR